MNKLEQTMQGLADQAGLDLQTLDGVDPTRGVIEVLNDLVEGSQGLAAVRLLPFAIGARHAIWWGLTSLISNSESSLHKEAAQLQLALSIERWLMEPSDSLRREVGATSEVLGYEFPICCLGLGVFLSEGSLGPADVDEVPAPRGTCARAIGESIVLECLLCDPLAAEEQGLNHVQACLELLKQETPWTDTAVVHDDSEEGATP